MQKKKKNAQETDYPKDSPKPERTPRIVSSRLIVQYGKEAR